MKTKFIIKCKAGLVLAAILGFTSCKKDNDPEPIPVFDHGVFILNEGGFNNSNASLSYYNYENNDLVVDLYGGVNSSAFLGDVAQDIKKIGSKVYITLNGSNKVEILDSRTFKKLAAVTIASPRSLASSDGKVFVSSYDDNVYVLDVTTNQIVKKIPVGSDPEQMVVVGNKLYVANSGGLDYPVYENTVSVIDITQLTELKKITVSINPIQIVADSYGDVYVTTTGNYNDIKSDLYLINTTTDEARPLDVRVTGMALNGDLAYIYVSQYDMATEQTIIGYSTFNVKNETPGESFITDDTESSIIMPYGIGADPASGDIYLSDGKDYQTAGTVYRFGKDGKKKFSFTAGVLPARFLFVNK